MNVKFQPYFHGRLTFNTTLRLHFNLSVTGFLDENWY